MKSYPGRIEVGSEVHILNQRLKHDMFNDGIVEDIQTDQLKTYYLIRLEDNSGVWGLREDIRLLNS